ncbi:MAG: hypothetical protein ABSA03_15950 [Streptosporangiaceae bacterium]
MARRILGYDVATHAGEVRVNASGEPDRDDFGLPPVEIEIPDDARELDRDVQAYHRELRARRRQVRLGRLHAPLTRDGLVLPLLAGCLAMVLISGVLLTVFTAGQSGSPARSPAPSPRTTHAAASPAAGSASPAASPRAVQAAGRLPGAKVTISGQPVELSSLMIPSVLALVPSGCQCSAALRQIGRQAAAARVSLYLVSVGGDARQVRRLAARAGQPRTHVADDTSRALASAYHPRGLTAVLVSADGAVTAAVRDLGRGSRLAAGQLRSLAPASP